MSNHVERSPQQQSSLTTELQELLEQQSATADVLKAISRAPINLQSVLDSLVKTAAILCKADMSGLTRPAHEGHRHVANYGCESNFFQHLKSLYMAPGRDSIVGRVLQDAAAHQISDVLEDPDYQRLEAQRLGGFRTLLGVPLLRADQVIGVLVLYRTEVRPFTTRQIELLNTFADQAVIAIENARLFDELEVRTCELRTALDEQTATAEILRAISRSQTDIQPVFQTIARQAVKICNGLFANVFLYQDGRLNYVASHETNPAYVDLLRRKYPMVPDQTQVSGRVVLSGEIVRLEDATQDPNYDQQFPEAMGWRRMLGVPLRQGDSTIGAIVVGWHDSGPVPKAQEDLLNTFADQAIIAIEHVRLLRELEERNHELNEALQQQTATGDVLKAISRSTFDLQAILETLTHSAAALCEADMAAITRRDGDRFYYATNHNFPAEWMDYVKAIRPYADQGSVAGRVLSSGEAVQITDVLADPDYGHLTAQPKAGFRTLLGVPLIREGNSFGAIILARKNVAPFTAKQIEIVSTFADQAVIAIENVRLFDEIQAKSEELGMANQFKSRFLSAASHDLRQPLHALNLFVDQLRNEPDPAERNRLVSRIGESVRAINELFETLLDMSKLEAGVVAKQEAVFPIIRMLRRLETTFALTASARSLRLSVRPSHVSVRSDFILLERMLINLVSNALRYTNNGGILVGTRRRGAALRIDIVDTGPGIPLGERSKIFSEFYQLERPTQARRDGLGLGLSIVDRLGRLLGHKIELASQVGRGSRFSIYVPIADGDAVNTREPPVLSSLPDRISGQKILVIDDDRLVLDGMRGILKGWGCMVTAACSAEEALIEISDPSEPPALIICDFRLAGGHSGIDAIHRLRDHFQKNIAAFLMSGDTEPERLREASDSGFLLLHKPVLPMTLRAMINRLLAD
jgi:signal transduction histidine kinase/CheY-like chemotaxis protein